VIKLVLSLQHQTLPRSLHAAEPTPHVDWSSGTIKLLNEAVSWKTNGSPRRAAVSSFGIGGTNAHVIVEEAQAAELVARAPLPSRSLPFVLSAKGRGALRAQAQQLHAYLREHPELDLNDVAHTLATLRSTFDVRAVLVANERQPLMAALSALMDRELGDASGLDAARSAELAVLFSGQGSQLPQMGLALYTQLPAFREALDAVFAAFEPWLSPPLKDVMFAAPGSELAANLDTTAYTQPALFALELALYRALEAYGVRPKYLLGHSLGEITAAHVAGVMSLDDACQLVAARARLMQALPAGGAMIAIEASEQELAELPADVRHAGAVSLAAINAERAIVVSGDEAPVLAVAAHFEASGRRVRRLAVSHAFHSAHMDAMLEPFEQLVAGLTLRPARMAIISNLSGELADPTQFCEPSYWVRQVREAVRFHPGVMSLKAAGASAFLEVGPQAVLATLVQDALSESEEAVPVWSVLQKGADELDSFLRALGGLHEIRHTIDWRAWVEAHAGHFVTLPTYPFQRTRYWLANGIFTQDAAALGLAPAEHPLLNASLAFAEGERALWTGRLSLASHAWLTDHTLFGRVVLPSSAWLEMALSIAEQLELSAVDQLVVEKPLALLASGAVQLQVSVAEPDAQGRRTFAVHSRTEQRSTEAWTRHVTGTLSTGSSGEMCDLSHWPPPGAAGVELDDVYDTLSDSGVRYGASFRVLRAVYRRGEEWFAELALPDSEQGEAGRYALHPALLEAASQVALLRGDSAQLVQPVAFHGVRLLATGESELRLRLGPDAADGCRLSLASVTGEPVAELESIALRSVTAEASTETASPLSALYGLHWIEAERAAAVATSCVLLGADMDGEPGCSSADLAALQARLDSGEPAPAHVVCLALGATTPGLIEAARKAAHQHLALLQSWLRDERLAGSRLSFLTRRAVAAAEREDVLDLSHAPLWGVLRSAQSEYPERELQLIDLDSASLPSGWSGDLKNLPLLAAALASSEPQLALRDGRLLAPRMTPTTPSDWSTSPLSACADGTILISGGTGTLGALLARHLVARHGARHLLLVSRSGRADALQAELAALGVAVRVAACDLTQRADVQHLLASIPSAQPLAAIIHAAGVTDDGILASQTPERFDRVLDPKLAGAWHLHELTRDLPLRAFVMFSSVSGVVGGPGQSNYAAANVFLDALAQHRKASGLAASSLAWGFWAERSALNAHLDEASLARMARGGVEPLSAEHGLSLFDAALARQEALLIPARFNLAALAAAPLLPSMLTGLVPRRRRKTNAASALRARLATLDEKQQSAHVLSVVRAAVAAATGVEASSVQPARPLRELGLDSLMALELRRALATQTGLRLSATLLFDYPTPAKLAALLLQRLAPEAASASSPVLAELDRLDALLSSVQLGDNEREALEERLKAFSRKWMSTPTLTDDTRALEHSLRHADDEELYRLIKQSLAH
jgi:acyl transferase domain-containing protein